VLPQHTAARKPKAHPTARSVVEQRLPLIPHHCTRSCTTRDNEPRGQRNPTCCVGCPQRANEGCRPRRNHRLLELDPPAVVVTYIFRGNPCQCSHADCPILRLARAEHRHRRRDLAQGRRRRHRPPVPPLSTSASGSRGASKSAAIPPPPAPGARALSPARRRRRRRRHIRNRRALTCLCAPHAARWHCGPQYHTPRHRAHRKLAGPLHASHAPPPLPAPAPASLGGGDSRTCGSVTWSLGGSTRDPCARVARVCSRVCSRAHHRAAG
jgi:hypothetical protein